MAGCTALCTRHMAGCAALSQNTSAPLRNGQAFPHLRQMHFLRMWHAALILQSYERMPHRQVVDLGFVWHSGVHLIGSPYIQKKLLGSHRLRAEC